MITFSAKHLARSALALSVVLTACTQATTPPVIIHPGSSSSSTVSSKASSSLAAASSSISKVPTTIAALAVPFSPQAPTANWDSVHEEACEEMSLIMVKHFWNKEPLTAKNAEEELQQLLSWEKTKGYGEDVTVHELANIANAYGWNATVEEATADRIRQHLRDGRPIIIPAAGRQLGNPNFSGAGPWYHMLVITGSYDGGFITNDPGTKRGEGYRYDENTLMNAIHDWTGVKEETYKGKRLMLVVEPQ